MRSWRELCLIIVGVLFLLVGTSTVICAGLNVHFKSRAAYVGTGFWAGTTYFAAGLFGLVGGILKNRCVTIVFLVVSILVAVLFVAPLIGLSWYDVQFATSDGRLYLGDTSADAEAKASVDAGAYWHCKKIDPIGSIIRIVCFSQAVAANNIALIVFGGIAFVLAIVGAILASCAVCRCGGATTNGAYSPKNDVQMTSQGAREL